MTEKVDIILAKKWFSSDSRENFVFVNSAHYVNCGLDV